MIDMTTMPFTTVILLAWLNFIMCAGIGWSCLCRVALMSSSTTRPRFRAIYALLTTAAFCSGLSPILWNEWPGPGQLMMGLAAGFVLGWGANNWRNGPPDYARK